MDSEEGELRVIVKDFKELIVWQKSSDLVVEAYKLTKDFPKEELYGLISQIRRAAVSIPTNISEGYSRKSTNEFIQFVHIALSSASELETLLCLSNRLSFLSKNDNELVANHICEVKRLLRGLINSLKARRVK
ncbi:MAG: four helix bundle protein [Candidatus Omnitrophica bacterium]|nr:four helix bundle protein [Candidatus Omnitrophota bacterium]